MQKKRSSLPFKGTPEQEAKLKAIIEAHKHDSSYLMKVMQEAQDIYGYLPFEVQEMIAEGTTFPSASAPLATSRVRATSSTSSPRSSASVRMSAPPTVVSR